MAGASPAGHLYMTVRPMQRTDLPPMGRVCGAMYRPVVTAFGWSQYDT